MLKHLAATARKMKAPELTGVVLEDFYRDPYGTVPNRTKILDFYSGPHKHKNIHSADPYGFEYIPKEPPDPPYTIILLTDVLTNYPPLLRRKILITAESYLEPEGFLLITCRNWFQRQNLTPHLNTRPESITEPGTYLIGEIPYHYYRPMELLAEIDWYLGENNSGPVNHLNQYEPYQTITHIRTKP